MIAPAATCGRPVTAATSASSRRSGGPGGRRHGRREGAAVGARLRALDAQPVRAAPAASAASSGVVTVTHTWLPRRPQRRDDAGSGQPKVKLTTAVGGPAGRPASHPSRRRPSRGCPGGRPARRRPAPARPGSRRVPRGPSVPRARTRSPRTARAEPASATSISARMAAAVLYPAARKPSAPAAEAASTSPAVEGPPAIGATTTGHRASRCEHVSHSRSLHRKIGGAHNTVAALAEPCTAENLVARPGRLSPVPGTRLRWVPQCHRSRLKTVAAPRQIQPLNHIRASQEVYGSVWPASTGYR